MSYIKVLQPDYLIFYEFPFILCCECPTGGV